MKKLQKIFVIRVQAKEDCWIRRSIQGDPGRTLHIDAATVFTKIKAQGVLHELEKDYPNRKFEIEPAPTI